MAAYDVVQFDGTPLSAGTDYDAWLDARDQYVMTGSVDSISRRSAAPLVTGTAGEGRTLTLHVANAAGSSLTAAQFRDAVKALFDPRLNASGERILVIEGDDGTTDVQTGCYVMQWEYLSQGVDQYVITLWSPSGVWQATSVTSNASPATVTNAGNTIAYPTIELTTGTHVTRRACTVQASAANLPLINYPIVFALNDANATSTNTVVFIEGRMVPCYVDDSGLSTSRVWALVNAVSSRTTKVDILYGTGLVNPLSPLDKGGMDWDDATNCHNTQWQYEAAGWSTLLSNEPRPGVWRPALFGNHNEDSAASYGITSVAPVTIEIGVDGAFDNAANAIKLRIEGATAAASNALDNLRRVTANLDGTNARAFVRYRVAGSTTWQDAWTQTSNFTETGATVNVPSAVEIVVGLENFGATADPSSLALNAVISVEVQLANTPTVVVGSAENFDRYDGPYTIGARSITFSDYMVPDGTLTINAEARTITSSVDGPTYWLDDETAIQYSHPDQWFILEPGSNTVTDGLSATDTVKHQAAYV